VELAGAGARFRRDARALRRLPSHPGPAALFDPAERERVTVFGSSAKLLDPAAKAGVEPLHGHDLAALRTIPSTGSPLAPEGFDWVYCRVKRAVALASISGGTDSVSCLVLGSPVLPVWRGEIRCAGLAVREVVHGRPVRGREVLANPEALELFRDLPDLRRWPAGAAAGRGGSNLERKRNRGAGQVCARRMRAGDCVHFSIRDPERMRI